MNGASVEAVSELRATAVSAMPSTAIVAVPSAAYNATRARVGTSTSMPKTSTPIASSAATIAALTMTTRRTCAATNAHGGSGVPRRRLSWPDSRCSTSEIASVVNAADITA